MSAKVGFIGLGNMGEPAAANLLRKGFPLVVHDLQPARGRRLMNAGAVWADNPSKLAAVSDVVITSLPGPAQVAAVVEGCDGLVQGLRQGSTWIDMSTSDMHQMNRFAVRLGEMGVDVLEATATGGVQNAREGRITLFIGGPPTVFEANRTVLEGIGDRVLYMGELGRATITKLITNMMCFVNQAALAEGLMLGASAGLNLVSLLEAIQASYASSFSADVDGPQILDGSYDHTFTIGLVEKDMRLGLALAAEVAVPMEITAAVSRVVQAAKDRYGPEAGALSGARLLEERTGRALRADWPRRIYFLRR
jgi:3-hydroxyisobutyrate dehydrogenase